jgi:hypothetical protein
MGGVISAKTFQCYFVWDPDPEYDCPEEIVFPAGGLLGLLIGDIPRKSVVIFDWLALFIVIGVFALILMPVFTFLGPLVDAFIWVAQMIESGVMNFFYLWYWGYEQLRGWIETIQVSTEGSPMLFWILAMELLIFSVGYVALGIFTAGQKFISSPAFDVYNFLNTPFRWFRKSVLQALFGKFLGNVISLFFFPLEALLVIISILIGLIIYAFRLMRDPA